MADLTDNEIFEDQIANRMKNDPDRVKGINAIYQFDITGDTACTWVVDCTVEGGNVKPEADPNAQCTITVSDTDFINIINGSLNAQMAFMQGKLKVKGNMGLAMKLQSVLK